MVFSQTSHKTQSILKVVEIDRLKPKKEQQANGQTGVITGGNTETMPSWSAPETSFSEELLKEEPVYDSTMFYESDCEFFQDLVQWCSDPAKEEPIQTIDSKKLNEERAHNSDTIHTSFSPQGWEAFDTNSPTAPTGAYGTLATDPLSSPVDEFGQYTKPLMLQGLSDPDKMQEEFLDFNNMPVVFGDLDSSKPAEISPVQGAELIGWNHLHNNNNTNTDFTNTQNPIMPFDEDSKLVSVIPRELESNDVIITEVIFGPSMGKGGNVRSLGGERRQGLTVNIPARSTAWPTDLISTPDVVNCVEQLEKDNPPPLPILTTNEWPVEDNAFVPTKVDIKKSPQVEYEPITPKSESQAESENEERYTSRKRRYDSEDSDATYTPYQEPTPRRKYTRRKPNIPIKDMIKALESSQPQTKAKRGRPPKRRISTVSSVCSVDENSSTVSTHETNYRIQRDKNNEASKRSRMNRKLKELQMEQLVIELEEKNKKLQIKADILEDMTKRLKDALMTAILQKK